MIVEIHNVKETGKFGLVVFKPSTYSSSTTYPLVVFLAGIGARGDGSDSALQILAGNETPPNLQEWTDKKGFIIVSVQTSGSYLSGEVDFAHDWAIKNLSIDSSRKYLTGLSLGGGGTANYITSGSTQASKFAAACGIAMTPDTTGFQYVVDANLPLWFFHNLNDTNGGTPVSATNNFIDGINALNPKIRATKTIFNAVGHGGWAEAYALNGPIIPAGSTGMIIPSVSLADWFLMNKIGSSVAVPGIMSSTSLTAIATTDGKAPQGSLDGSKSSNFKSAGWACTKRPASVNPYANILTGGSGWYTTSYTLPVPGDYEFTLTVYDKDGYSGNTATAKVAVSWSANGGTTTTTTSTTSSTTTSTSTLSITKVELSRTYIPKLGKYCYVYDDGTTEIK
jgi:dienelactone hydrolase